jgi:hypothetical protein
MSHGTGGLVPNPEPFEFDGERFPVVPMPNGDFGIPLRRLTLPVDLDPDGQRRLIERSAWSKGRTDTMTVQLPGDTQARSHFVISHRIVPMWIANIGASQIKDDAKRERIERWQVELADALYNYVFSGGAINPRATEDQLAAIVGRAESKIRMLSAAKGLVDDRWLEGLTREQIAIGLGQEPEPAADTRFLTVADYLGEHGLTATEIRKISPTFGRRLKVAFVAKHGEPPGKSLRFVDGAQREVFVYTEADRSLFDVVWGEFSDD